MFVISLVETSEVLILKFFADSGMAQVMTTDGISGSPFRAVLLISTPFGRADSPNLRQLIVENEVVAELATAPEYRLASASPRLPVMTILPVVAATVE